MTESTEIDFVDLPLSEAIRVLGDLHKLAIIIDKETLSAASIATDQPVSLFISGVSLRSGLKLLLEPLLLDYVIKNEVLLITTMEKTEEIMETRVYNVARIPHLTPKELVEIIVGGSGADGHGGGAAPSGGAEAGAVPDGAGGVGGLGGGGSSRPVMASNSTLIPYSRWEQIDGEGGTAWAGKTTLIIRQTQRVHHEIVELLNQLTQEEAASTKAGPGDGTNVETNVPFRPR